MPIEVGVSLLLTFMTTEVGVSHLVTHMGASLPFADSHHHQIGRLPVAHFVSTKVGVSVLRTPAFTDSRDHRFRFSLLPTLVGLSFLLILCDR